MEGQPNENEAKQNKPKTRDACDVGCQTEMNMPPKYESSPNKNYANSSSGVAGGSQSSAQTAPATNKTANVLPNEPNKCAPAGVKPNTIADYFADKQTASPGYTKTRTSSTTGVVGEGKKCVRSQASMQQATSSSNTTNAGNKTETPLGDESCTLRLSIERFSHLDETMCSEAKSIDGVSWKIMVMPKQHMVQKKQQKCMGFFLQCSPEKAYSDLWNVHAVADMRMLSYKSNIPNFSRRTTHTYTAKENDWGYSCFMTWADILDENQGYIHDDVVVLEITVKADPAKNMMSHTTFLEKIEKWMNLAEMQMQKGNIDLAIEANTNAMRFCKEKDDECLARLEAQKETFVNAKLFESIERIEKGKTPVACSDASHGKSTSLRQALTGAQKSLNGKMTAKNGKKTRAVVTVQHMKKKKPYEQNQQARINNNGNSTAKDVVENKKNNKVETDKNKTDEKAKTLEQHLQQELKKDNSSIKIKQLNSAECEAIMKENDFGSMDDEEEDYDDEEEVYNEGDYADQALDVGNNVYNQEPQVFPFGDMPSENTDCLQDGDDHWESSCEDIQIPALVPLDENLPVYQGYNDAGIMMCDRTTQTDDSSNDEAVSECDTMEIFEQARQTDSDSTVRTEYPPFKKTKDDESLMRQNSKNIGMINQQLDSNAYLNYVYGKSGGVPVQYDSNGQYAIPNEFPPKWMDAAQQQNPSVTSAFQFLAESGNLQRRLGMEPENENEISYALSRMGLDDNSYMCLNYQGSGAKSPIFTVPGTNVQGGIRNMSEKILRDWQDIDAVMLSNLSPDSVITSLSDEDRKKLLDEISEKLHPLIVTLNFEFRDSLSAARTYLESSQNVYAETLNVLRGFEKLRYGFDNRIMPALGVASNQINSPKGTPVKEKTVTSAAATSGSKNNTKNRPTVIAKRSIKQPAPKQSNNQHPSQGCSNTSTVKSPFNPAAHQLPPINDRSMPEILTSLRTMNNHIGGLLMHLRECTGDFDKQVAEFFGENGISKLILDMDTKHLAEINSLNQEFTVSKTQIAENQQALAKLEKEKSETALALQAEIDKQSKTAKEIKDLRNQLKKAENRATKEETRATNAQIQLNETEEKLRGVKKEVDALKKKSAEERAKAKREKDKDVQMLKQQSNEITEKENEKDKVKKELDETNRVKEKVEKDRRHVTNQLNSAVERARSAEVLVLDVRMQVSLDSLKKRKFEAVAGFSETEQNMNRARQESDKELLRKSLAEWKMAVDKCDAQIKNASNDYESAIEQVKNGVKTLAQIGDIKIATQEVLPKLVKPPPVQVVAPSSAVIPAPIHIPAPAVGVIGQRNTITARNQTCSTDSNNVSTCSTPTRPRRAQSPIGTPSKTNGASATAARTASDDNPVSSLWSWNTIGNLGDLRPSSRTDGSFSALDSLQRGIWAANGSGIGGSDFFRQATSSLTGSTAQSPFLTLGSGSQQSTQPPTTQSSSQSGINRIRGYSDIWGTTSTSSVQNPIQQPQTVQQQPQLQQAQSQQQSHQQQMQQQQHNDGNFGARGIPSHHHQIHNGSGDHSGNIFPPIGMGMPSSASTWRSQQQMGNQLHHQRPPGNHPNQFPHPFYDGGV